MRRIVIGSVVAALLSFAPAALAQTPVAAANPVVVKQDALIKTSDNRALGRVERVIRKDGIAVAATVIVESHIVAIPIETISGTSDGLVTSLSYADVRKLK